MKNFIKSLPLLFVSLNLLITLPAAAHELKPGELLTLVLVANKPGAEEAATAYRERAFSLAKKYGMQEVTSLKVKNTVLGDEMHGFGLYLWPSKEAAHHTRQDADYRKHIGPLRKVAWKRLEAIDMSITESQSLSFNPDKVYSLALVWIEDEAAYYDYLHTSQAIRDDLGAKTLLKLVPTRYEDLAVGVSRAPGLAVLLEWDNADLMMEYGRRAQAAPYFKQFENSISRFEWYQLTAWD